MNSMLTNWKTTAAGVAAAGLYAVAQAYTSGMTWKQWLAAAGIALLGLVSKDHNA